MNKASRCKDVNKIEFYGPLASALSFIVHCGNKNNTDLAKKIKVYRGLSINVEELNSKYVVGKSITLQGFTSTTQDREVALGFATNSPVKENCEPLLIEILIKSDQ